MMYYLLSKIGKLEQRNPSFTDRSRTYKLAITSPDTPTLSFMRLVGAKAIKLGYCDESHLFLCAYTTHRRSNPSSLQDVCLPIPYTR